MEIEIKYFSREITKIEPIQKGCWIDLRCADTYVLKKGDFKLLNLGIGMKIPVGYEAIVAPRSSTFKTWGIIQTNSIGVIDGPSVDNNGIIIPGTGYCGEMDCWFMPVYATRDTVIHRDSRVCQFRLQERMPQITFKEVEHLEDISRGGHGSSGIN